MSAIKRILVTGGTGYIGSNVCKIMAALNPKIQVVALSIEKKEEILKKDPYLCKFKNVEIVEGNCLDPQDYRLVD